MEELTAKSAQDEAYFGFLGAGRLRSRGSAGAFLRGGRTFPNTFGFRGYVSISRCDFAKG